MKLPAASCGVSQNSILMTPRKQDETEENPVASYGEYSSLIQLADYVAGVVSRKIQGKKKEAAEYYRYIAAKEVLLRVWPE